jgi:parallel beta-helix repeat protein
MKKNRLLLFIVSFSAFKAGATNYYLAASGNNANAGTSAAVPWQTIAKLNTVTYLPGDTVYFNRSDAFEGEVIVNQSGNSSSRIVFTSYGIGDSPVILGSQVLSGWTAAGSYYTAPFTGVVGNFFVNGKEQTLARYPNEHVYLTLDSAQTGYLRDGSLAGLNPNLISGSNVCVHSSQGSWEKAGIASFSGDKIIYNSAMLRAGNNCGYFLYNNLQHLDTANEWLYDPATHILYYYPPSGIDPNAKTCHISIYANGIQLGANASYISIKNLAFENQSGSGIEIGSGNSTYISIDGCYFSGQYNYGVNVKGKYCSISNSYFRDIDGIAVYVSNPAVSSTVDHNHFVRNGVTRVSGLGGQFNGTALMCSADSNYFHHNSIDSTGYCGIFAEGKHNLVERNIIDHALLVQNDGGGIKARGPGTTQSVYRNNFIANSDGNTEGIYQPDFSTPAIYFDFNVNNCTISGNTVYNHTRKGIFHNSSNHDNTVTGNVIYGGSYLLDINGTNLAPSAVPVSGMIVKHNSFFSRDSNSIILKQVDYTGAFNAGTLDSNYYFQPYNSNRYAERLNGTTPVYYTFSSWQMTGNDTHSVNSFVNWVYPFSSDTLIMNKTDYTVSVNLGSNKFLDLDSNVICGNIVLQPYSSRILINTKLSCLTATTDFNNRDQVKIYPNPAVGEITVLHTPEQPLSRYEIMDTYGRVILTGNITPNQRVIETGTLSPGLYVILFNGDTRYRVKMIKK